MMSEDSLEQPSPFKAVDSYATGDAEMENTDKELWRAKENDYYSPSIHVTKEGKIGINVGGDVFVKDIRDWHKLAAQ